MIYNDKQINSFNQKDKRISFLSLFSSLINSKNGFTLKQIENMAYEINDRLYEKYPVDEINEEEKPL